MRGDTAVHDDIQRCPLWAGLLLGAEEVGDVSFPLFGH
jgi:hypothetical protein